jgi:hypothetical protein
MLYTLKNGADRNVLHRGTFRQINEALAAAAAVMTGVLFAALRAGTVAAGQNTNLALAGLAATSLLCAYQGGFGREATAGRRSGVVVWWRGSGSMGVVPAGEGRGHFALGLGAQRFSDASLAKASLASPERAHMPVHCEALCVHAWGRNARVARLCECVRLCTCHSYVGAPPMCAAGVRAVNLVASGNSQAEVAEYKYEKEDPLGKFCSDNPVSVFLGGGGRTKVHMCVSMSVLCVSVGNGEEGYGGRCASLRN